MQDVLAGPGGSSCQGASQAVLPRCGKSGTAHTGLQKMSLRRNSTGRADSGDAADRGSGLLETRLPACAAYAGSHEKSALVWPAGAVPGILGVPRCKPAAEWQPCNPWRRSVPIGSGIVRPGHRLPYGAVMPGGLLDVNGARSTASAGARSPAKTTSSKPPTKPKFLRNCQKCSRAWLLSLSIQKSG